ncbi:hypothetical protein IJH01_00040 [Candidatus Saccharibacteria bacterium]|nr:hypothetical protein [Candidatus Saccharibacteria bacterium]
MPKIKILLLGLICSLAVGTPALAINEVQETAVKERCDTIKEALKETQKEDARARVYLGAFYEKILTDFITPLNVRLVENNLSTPELVENQNKIADTRTLFMSDFVNYQQDLEELTMMNCREKTEDFYNKLIKVRQKRKIVEQDTLKMRNLISEHVKLANQIKGKL